jgi:hypothetical protein
MIEKTEILRLIWCDKLIDEAIRNVVSPNFQSDFKSHFILEVSKKEEVFLNALISRGELPWFCLKIITNQWRSKTSSFWKEWRNSGLPNSITIDYRDDMTRFDGEDSEAVWSPQWKEVKIEIEILLEKQYEDFLTNTYHGTLFRMYYFKRMKLKEIKAETGIDMMAISRSIKKTKQYLKEEIKLWKE